MRTHRILMTGATAAIAVGTFVFGASPATAGVGAPQVKIAKDQDGPFKERVTHKFDRPQSHTYFFKAKSLGPGTDEFLLDASGECSGSGTSFKFKTGFSDGNNITEPVCGSGFIFGLDPNDVRKFRLRVSITNAAPGPPAIGSMDIRVRNTDDVIDSVRARAKIVG